MRVCLVSTYAPQRCGIGTYTRALAHGLAATGPAPVVLSELGALDGDDGKVASRPVFRRDEDYGPLLEAAAIQAGADVVHVQHSPDIFGMDARLPGLLERLRARGVRSVVTLHTVHTPRSGALERHFHVAAFHRRVAGAADAIVVHGARTMPDQLVRQGVPRSKIHSIAHGTENVSGVDRKSARERLGISENARVLLFFGFIHPQKNVHTLLLAMKRCVSRVPTAELHVVGSLQNPSSVNRLYVASLHGIARAARLENHVIFRHEFVPADEAVFLYGAADLVLLPYAQGYGSASGIAHHALGLGRVPLCSRSPKFEEIAEAIDPALLVPTHSPRAWAHRMAALLTDEPRRTELEARVRRYAAETSWPEVARRHFELYDALVPKSESR